MFPLTALKGLSDGMIPLTALKGLSDGIIPLTARKGLSDGTLYSCTPCLLVGQSMCDWMIHHEA